MKKNSPSRSKIGILGGSFDPIHLGHLQLAQWTLQQLNLNKILFIPAATPPHKQHFRMTSELHRLNMVKLALKNYPQFEVSEIEINRRGISYTIDTILELKREFELKADELFLIIGADNLVTFYSWRKPQQILQECQVVVFRRPGFDLSAVDANLLKKVLILETPLLPISSTKIREILKKGGDPAEFVPEEVLKYIKQHNLYR